MSLETAQKMVDISSETIHQKLTVPRQPDIRWIIAFDDGDNNAAQMPIAAR